MKKLAIVRKVAAIMTIAAMTAAASAFGATVHHSHFKFSSNPRIKAEQHAVYDIVQQYASGLDTANTKKIVNLFARNAVAEWNNHPTVDTRQEMIDGYDALFKFAKFSTAPAIDAINVYGDTAVVRSHHYRGTSILEHGKKVLDRNREVFVMRKIRGKWKIVLYIFNADAVQGEA
jgi:ketosteroid isomerase-like protein